MSPLQVSSISLSSWRASPSQTERDRMAAVWEEAFSSHGLLYLTEHGLTDLYKRVAEDWLEFCQCEEEHKDRFSSRQYGECGYNRVGKEAVSLSEQGEQGEQGVADPVESLENGYSSSLTGSFPRSETGYRHGDKLRDSYRELYTRLDCDVIRPCLDIASRALRLEQDLQSVWYREGPGACQLRLAHYVPGTGGGKLLYGEHTDYDGLTFLWRNRSNGLQACCDGQWQDIPLLDSHPDALLINLGDLMEFWTSSRWHSPLHRVLRGAQTENDLLSVVMFAGPHPDTRLEPLRSPLIPMTDEVRDVMTAGHHVKHKIRKTAL